MLVNQSVTYVGELDHLTAQAVAKRRPGLNQQKWGALKGRHIP